MDSGVTEYPNPFATATAIQGLVLAKGAGATVSGRVGEARPRGDQRASARTAGILFDRRSVEKKDAPAGP